MRRDLSEAIDEVVWPVGAQLQEFTPESARAVHDVLAGAYVDGSGFVDAFPAWWAALKADAEFDPRLVFVARDEALQMVGVALCWTSAFIKDLAVRRDWRRAGSGRALLLHAFAEFEHARGDGSAAESACRQSLGCDSGLSERGDEGGGGMLNAE